MQTKRKKVKEKPQKRKRFPSLTCSSTLHGRRSWKIYGSPREQRIVLRWPIKISIAVVLQEELSRAFPNLFRLLWKSTLPCYPSNTSSESAHMLRQCWWRGEQINCSEIFTPVITDTGVCCAFNLRTDLKASIYSQLVQEIQVWKRSPIWGFLQVKAGAPANGKIWKATSRADRGLKVIVDRNFNRWKAQYSAIFSGWAMALSSPRMLASNSSSDKLMTFLSYRFHKWVEKFDNLERRSLLGRPHQSLAW